VGESGILLCNGSKISVLFKEQRQNGFLGSQSRLNETVFEKEYL